MQTKIVPKEEIINYIELSKKPDHPFYYRFSYRQDLQGIEARRIHKGIHKTTITERRSFLQPVIDSNSSIANAFKLINSIKGQSFVR